MGCPRPTPTRSTPTCSTSSGRKTRQGALAEEGLRPCARCCDSGANCASIPFRYEGLRSEGEPGALSFARANAPEGGRVCLIERTNAFKSGNEMMSESRTPSSTDIENLARYDWPIENSQHVRAQGSA